jgi:hypothetical protein
MDPRDRVKFDTSTQKPTYYNQKTKGQTNSPSQQSRKKKTCHYFGNIGHVEKVCYKKRDYLEEKVEFLEGNVPTELQPIDNFAFQDETYQALLSHST